LEKRIIYSGGIATGYALEGWVSILSSGKFFRFSIASKPALRPTQSPTQWVPGDLSTRVKHSWFEADQLPASSNEVKNYGGIPPFSHKSSWVVLN
jgi:hypothetical protein